MAHVEINKSGDETGRWLLVGWVRTIISTHISISTILGQIYDGNLHANSDRHPAACGVVGIVILPIFGT